MSANMALRLCLFSLANNALCGVNEYGNGTYTAEGINALCEGLKGSAITSLKCARPPPTHESTLHVSAQ